MILTKLKITTHSGNEYEAIVDDYNAEQLNENLNSTEINTVVIGDIIISRIDVKAVVPIEEIEEIEEVVEEVEQEGEVLPNR